MAKSQRKHQILSNDRVQGHIVEETFDSSFLPDAGEIRKLHEIDPSIVEWLKSSAEREQGFQHEAFNKKIALVRDTEKGERMVNFMGG